jgi:hypothetical protein
MSGDVMATGTVDWPALRSTYLCRGGRVADDKAAHEKALDLFVYAPVGVALYVRDMLPTMMNIFVARGKREVQSHIPSGAGPEAAPAAPPPPNPADVRRRVEESIGIARVAAGSGVGVARGVAGSGLGFAKDLAGGLAGSARAGFGTVRVPGAPAAPSAPDAPVTPTAPSAPAPPRVTVTSPPVTPRPTVPSPAPAAAAHTTAAPPVVDALPIPDYDELSASQVVERLDGLDRESLDAIRRYEAAHRGRNTILGKIAQLS